MASPKLSDKETLAIVEDMRQQRVESVKNFFTGMAKAITTDLPGFLMDIADKAIDPKNVSFGEFDRSAELFEKMTGIKTKSGSGGADELIGSMVNPVGVGKAVILPAFATGKSVGALKEAIRLSDAGLSPQEIFARTGIYRDPVSSTLKGTISDQSAVLNTNYLEQTPRSLKYKDGRQERILMANLPDNRPMLLSDVLKHPEITAVSPGSLSSVTLKADPTGFGGGAFNPSRREITLQRHKSAKDLQSTLLHEVQHVLQNDFSMAQGGNPNIFLKDPVGLEAAKSKLTALLTDEDYVNNLPDNAFSELFKAQKTLRDLTQAAYDSYLHIPGEAEARAVESIFASPTSVPKVPTAYYDVDINKLIDNPNALQKLDDTPAIRALLDYINKLPQPAKK